MENLNLKKENLGQDFAKQNPAPKTEEKNNSVNLEVKIIGWAGTILLILAYGLNSLGYIESSNILYPILNLIAAILLAIRVWVDRNWSNLFLEAFWGAIAVVSIIKYFNLF